MKQPYYQAYKNKHPNRKYKSYEYIAWITEKHREFRQIKGLREGQPYTDKQREKFIEFIGS